MGNKQACLREGTFVDKSTYLFLSKEDMEQLFRVFYRYSTSTSEEEIARAIDDAEYPREEVDCDPRIWEGSSSVMKLMRIEQFLMLPCIRCNPFAPRLFDCFKDTRLGMSFSAFVLLASVMDASTPADVKSVVAFRVFDFDDDKVVNQNDILRTLEVITGVRDLWKIASQTVAGVVVDERLVSWSHDLFPRRKCRHDSGTPGSVVYEAAKALGHKSALGRNAPDDALQPRSPCNDDNAIFGADDYQTVLLPRLKGALEQIAERVFHVMDVDGSDCISPSEFERIVLKVPDFRVKFSLSFLLRS
ncbi:hypothetical protein DIPPA_22026 [Diplonema papillatum]|nr:hypothetical protein DIPPA_22026 [Diplonema papillatum]